MNSNGIDADDQQLDDNLLLLNSELCSLIECKETLVPPSTVIRKSAASGVLHEINHKLNDLNLNANGDEDGAVDFENKVPEFEFHGYGCTQSIAVLPRRIVRAQNRDARKKSKSKNNGNVGSLYGCRQNQKENLFSQMQTNALNVEKFCSLDLTGDCMEQNSILRLVELFNSLHCHISSDLPSNQMNSVPSDYAFDFTYKSAMPDGFNVRHHVQVLYTKLDRFLNRLRRILETNRTFDYIKYTECDLHLISAFHHQRSLKQFTNVELRQRSLQFITQAGKDNAKALETLLLELRDSLKSAHIYVHVFNWEMDLEHRYSAAMTATHEATISKALTMATSEVLASKTASQLTPEDQYIADHYQLTNIVSSAKKHEEFLNSLLHSPETYFLPEIVAICEPPKDFKMLPVNPQEIEGEYNMENLVFDGGIFELQPSSPPRVQRRSHMPRCNRA